MALNTDEIEWQYDEGGWQPFSDRDQQTIERAHRMKRSCLRLENGWRRTFEVDLKEMCARNTYNGQRKEIRRFRKMTPEQVRAKRNKEAREAFLGSNSAAALKLFSKYEDPEYAHEDESERYIGENGVIALLEELDLDPMDPRVLVMAWKMDAQNMCAFSYDEFMTGLARLNSATTEQAMRQAIDFCSATDMVDDERYKDFYMFTFRYAKESGQRSLGKESAAVIWKLVLAMRDFANVDNFCDFVENTYDDKHVTRDTWSMTLEFFKNVGVDLSGYDEEMYPYLIDEFATWLKKSNKVVETKAVVADVSDDEDLDF